MGEFQRSYSKVWWSNFPDDEYTPSCGRNNSGDIPVISHSRGSSISPSNSHKSQDSGFSDSELPLDLCRENNKNKQKNNDSNNRTTVCNDLTGFPLCIELTPISKPIKGECRIKQHSPIQTLKICNGKSPQIQEKLSPAIESPVNFDFSDFSGHPAHTSTPKTSCSCGSSNKRAELFTPKRDLPDINDIEKKQYKPINLINNFENSTKEDSNDKELKSVHQWLLDLRFLYEPECTNTLQSKSLAVDLNKQVVIMAAATTDAVRTLQERTRLISVEFAKLCRQLDCGLMEHVGPLVQSLTGHVSEFLQHRGLEATDMEKDLTEVCDRLRLTSAKDSINKVELTASITSLGHKFTELVDLVLSRQISAMIAVIEDPPSDIALRSALSSLTDLGAEGSHICRLIAQCEGIRALLSICIDSQTSSIRTAALRALATICCVADAIRQLEKSGGIEILADLLAEEIRPEYELSEAVALLAQITAPWVEDNHAVNGLTEHLPSFIRSITRLICVTTSCETLLLAAAALANLTFMDPQAVWPILEYGTTAKLLSSIRLKGSVSVFLQEQVATLLANMATIPECRSHLSEQRAVVTLLCFLQIRHSPLQRAPEIAAAERVQQKSAIALSRLCSSPDIAAQIVELQGVSRLVNLCRAERERNHSDSVLVACLTTLRKIAATCGTEPVEDLDAMELIEPKLLDSFLLYSSKQESYV